MSSSMSEHEPSSKYGSGRSINLPSKEDPLIPDLSDPTQHRELTIELERLHSVARPPTPPLPPPTMIPTPLRYPDTLGSVICIEPTEGKGLGVFAMRDLEPGTILLCEAPLITLIDTGTRADPLDVAVFKLSSSRQASFRSLHAFSRSKHESRNRSIVYSNGYSILNDLATGVFETASRINHSCVPNSHYVWKDTPRSEAPEQDGEGKAKGRMVFYNRFKLLEGEEVTVDYGHKPLLLKRIYGFECTCGGCTEDGSDSILTGSRDADAGSEGSGRVGWSADVMEGEMKDIDEVIKEGVENGK